MKRVAWLALAGLLLAAGIVWCRLATESPTSERSRAGLQGAVRSLALYAAPGTAGDGARYLARQERFDKAGRLIESVEYRRDGTVASRRLRTYQDGRLLAETIEVAGEFRRDRHHYDPAGALLRVERRSAAGRLLETRRVTNRESVPLRAIAEEYAERYDTGKWARDISLHGRVVSGRIDAPDGARLGHWRETRDGQGRLLESVTRRGRGSSRVRIKVYAGDTLLRDTLLVDDVPKESVFFATGAGNEMIRTLIQHALDGAPLRRIIETRAEKRLISRQVLENSGIVGWSELFRYPEQDRYGNWLIREKLDAAGQLLEQQRRRIRYF